MTVSTESMGAGLAGPHPALAPRSMERELCQLVGDWTGRIVGPQIVEPKFDGIRALWIDGELVTREGCPIGGTEHIAGIIRALEHEACQPLFVDGEFLVDRSFDATLRHFRSGGAAGDAGTLWLWEAFPMRVWRGEDPSEALEARRVKLDRLVKPFECSALRLMPWAWMTDADEIARHARDYIAQGGEGIVAKQAGAVYQRSRSTIWQRIKRAVTVEARILGIEPLAGRPHMLGVLICDYRGKRVRVHAGFTDRERLELGRAWEGLVGQIAELEAMEILESGSLRQARWVRLSAGQEERVMAVRDSFKVERSFYGDEVADGMMLHALIEALEPEQSADDALAVIKLVRALIEIASGR